MSDIKRNQKVEILMKQYGISEEKTLYILTTDEDYLTLEELKIKYNNPTMGILPEWLSEEDLTNIIEKTIKGYSSSINFEYMDKFDLFNDIQLFVRKNSNKLKNFKYLKTMIINYIKGVIKNLSKDINISSIHLEQPLSNTEKSEHEYLLIDTIIDDKYNADNIVNLILNIKDEYVKKFLIVTRLFSL